jgi:hypothetical protein
MVKLAGGWIDLNERYGDMFKGDFNPNICNKFTLKVLGLTHHCKDCKVSTPSRISVLDWTIFYIPSQT